MNDYLDHGSRESGVLFDAVSQMNWLAEISQSDFRDWVRRFAWSSESFPIFIPDQSEIFWHICRLIDLVPTAQLASKIVLPELLREWRVNDGPYVLESLISLNGQLACVDAERHILYIIRNELPLINSERARYTLREALRTLSGFGASGHSIRTFEKYFPDIDYADICFWAIYEYDSELGAGLFLELVELYSSSDRATELLGYLEEIFVEFLGLDTERVSDFWRMVLVWTYKKKGEEGDSRLNRLLEAIGAVGIKVEYESPFSVDGESVTEFVVIDLIGVSDLLDQVVKIPLNVRNTAEDIGDILVPDDRILEKVRNVPEVMNNALNLVRFPSRTQGII